MKLILSNIIINLDRIAAIYVEGGYLKLDTGDSAYMVADVPDNALQQIAVAMAEGKPFLEMEGTAPMESD